MNREYDLTKTKEIRSIYGEEQKPMRLESFSQIVKDVMNIYGINAEKNAIFVSIFCRDDQSSTIRKMLEDSYTKYGLDYDMSTFGGIFHKYRTWEELVPPAHHIPPAKERYLVIFNFTHIGYDSETGKWGRFIRYGHKSCSASCGAINTIYSKIKNGEEIRSEEMKVLEEMIKDVILHHNVYELEDDKNTHIWFITKKLYEIQRDHLMKEVKKLAQEEKVNIIYFGGIEIDENKYGKEIRNDRILLKDLKYIDKSGNIAEININTSH